MGDYDSVIGMEIHGTDKKPYSDAAYENGEHKTFVDFRYQFIDVERDGSSRFYNLYWILAKVTHNLSILR